MSNLLITGGTGFVGSHLVEKAQQLGHQVYVLVRESSDTKHLEQLGVTCLKAGLTDTVALEQVFQNLSKEQIQLDSVIHCAALTKAKNLETFMAVNSTATTAFIRLLQKYQPNLVRFVFVSSLAASGPLEIGETIRLSDEHPITDYGKSKLAAEKGIRKTGIPHTIFRPTAVYGPREKDIFTLFQLVAKGVFPLIGSHPQALTFIYVKDLVDLLLKAIELAPTNQTFFVTDGNVYDKAALGDAIQQHLPKKPFRLTIPLPLVRGLAFVSQTFFGLQGKLAPLNNEKYKELKAASWVCDTQATTDTFDFKAQYDLVKGVAETTAWYQEEGWI